MYKFKTAYKTVQLEKGSMFVYDFEGGITLHAYETKDVFNSFLLLVEKDKQLLMIEPALLKDNYEELRDYINAIGYKEMDLIVSYHNLGASFPDTDKLTINKVYSMPSTEKYVYEIGVEANKQIKEGLGEVFDEKIYQDVILLEDGETTIKGIDLVIRENDYGFDIGIPKIGVMHTHFVGHDKHILVWNMEFLESTAKDLEDYLEDGYEMFMSAHGEPETRADAQQKVRYFKQLKDHFKSSGNGSDFKEKMHKSYPDLGWVNYLDVTAALLYNEPMPQMEG